MIALPTPTPAAYPLLHLIWLGHHHYRWVDASVARWRREVPEHWVMRLWTDADAPMLREIRSGAPHLSLRAQADLVRLAAVHRFGGVYLDVDTVPLRTAQLERDDDWIGAKPEGEDRTLINAHFGLRAGHPLLAALWTRAWEQIEAGVRDDHYIAGPRQWRKTYDALAPDERPTLVPTFPTVTSGPLTRSLPAGEPLDIKTLRAQHPGATALHVVYARSHAR